MAPRNLSNASAQSAEIPSEQAGATLENLLIKHDDGVCELTITQPDLRLDRALALATPEISRGKAQEMLESGIVCVNGAIVTKGSKKLKKGDVLRFSLPETPNLTPVAQNIPLDVIYEDEHIIVINKQAGLTVHPAAGAPDGTLVNALLYHCKAGLSSIGGVTRPGIVHRLDKDTSGLIVAAKTDEAHRGLSEQFSAHTAKRTYAAVIRGTLRQPHGLFNMNIGRSLTDRKKMAAVRRGGKPAVTHWVAVQRYRTEKLYFATLMRCNLETGRTHQIRVHFADAGYPLIGDATYGGRGGRGLLRALRDEAAEIVSGFPRQALHAKKLTLTHPITGKKMNFRADFPEDFKKLLADLAPYQEENHFTGAHDAAFDDEADFDFPENGDLDFDTDLSDEDFEFAEDEEGEEGGEDEADFDYAEDDEFFDDEDEDEKNSRSSK